MEPSTFKDPVQSITISTGFQGCYCLHPPALFSCLPPWQHFGLSRILTWQWGILLIRGDIFCYTFFLAFQSSGGRCKFLIYCRKTGLVDQYFYISFFFSVLQELSMHQWLCSIIYNHQKWERVSMNKNPCQ